MTQVKRYDHRIIDGYYDAFSEMQESKDGHYILYSDYEKLQAQLEKAEATNKKWQLLWEEEINLAPHQRGRKIYFNDEKIIQKQRKELREISQAGFNTLKSILGDQIGPDAVEKIIRNAEERAREYFKEKEQV